MMLEIYGASSSPSLGHFPFHGRSRKPARRVVHDLIYPEGGRARKVYCIDDNTSDREYDDMEGLNDPEGTSRVVLEDDACSPRPSIRMPSPFVPSLPPSSDPPPQDAVTVTSGTMSVTISPTKKHSDSTPTSFTIEE
jgi:hypothetical protein